MQVGNISIIIPSWNCANYLEEAIDSALRQSLVPREIIVINDGSTDHTDEIINQYAGRIIYHKQPNQGVASARNAGAQLSRSNWLLFLDADDILLPCALEKLYSLANEISFGVIYGLVYEFSDDGEETVVRGDNRCDGFAPFPASINFYKSAIIGPSAALVRKMIHNQIGGFDPTFQNAEDRDYFIQCGLLTGFKCCNEIVYRKRRRRNSAISHVSRTIYQGMLVQIKNRDFVLKHNIEVPFRNLLTDNIVSASLRKAVDKQSMGALCKISYYSWTHHSQHYLLIPVYFLLGWFEIIKNQMKSLVFNLIK